MEKAGNEPRPCAQGRGEPMGPVEALKLALRKEIEAHDLYQRLSDETASKVVRDTFIFLSNEEVRHRKLIEERLAEMTRD